MANKVTLVAVAAFVVVDVFLVAAALQHVRAPAPGLDEALPTPTSTSGQTDTKTGTSATQQTPSDGPGKQRSEVLLSVGVDGTILRATMGNCRSDETGEVEVSTDGGASFTPVYDDVPQVLRVVAVSRSDLWFVGTDDACRPSVQRSGDTGQSWVESEGTAGAYHLTATLDRSLVHAPDGVVTAGCAAIDLAPVNADVAFVGCADGEIRRTGDGGQSWVPVGQVDGLISLAFLNAQSGYALAAGSPCPAAVLATDDAGGTWKQTGCLNGETPETITANVYAVVAQADGSTEVSIDDGQTWAPAS